MTEGNAVVIAAIITVGGTVGGMVLTQLFNYLQRKADANEHLLLEAHQKRLSVYEDVIKELRNMNIYDLKKMARITGIEISEMIITNLHLLNALIARVTLFGSGNAVQILDLLRSQTLKMQDKCLAQPLSIEVGSETAIVLAGCVEVTLAGFISVVSEETGTDSVDKRFSKILKKKSARKKLKKEPRGEDDTPIN